MQLTPLWVFYLSMASDLQPLGSGRNIEVCSTGLQAMTVAAVVLHVAHFITKPCRRDKAEARDLLMFAATSKRVRLLVGMLLEVPLRRASEFYWKCDVVNRYLRYETDVIMRPDNRNWRAKRRKLMRKHKLSEQDLEEDFTASDEEVGSTPLTSAAA